MCRALNIYTLKGFWWLSFYASRGLTSQQHPHCLQGQSLTVLHASPMQFSCQGSNVSSSNEATEPQGKAGEKTLGLPGLCLGKEMVSPCSITATANLPLCNTSGRVNHKDQKMRIKMNPMLTRKQWSSLKMLLLKASQGAMMFSLLHLLYSQLLFPKKATSYKYHHSEPHLHPLFSPASWSACLPIHPSQQCSSSSCFASTLILPPPQILWKYFFRLPQNLCFT